MAFKAIEEIYSVETQISETQKLELFQIDKTFKSRSFSVYKEILGDFLNFVDALPAQNRELQSFVRSTLSSRQKLRMLFWNDSSSAPI